MLLLLLLLIISIRSIRISFLSGVLRFVFVFSHLSSFAPRDGGQSRAFFFLLVAVLSFNRGFLFGQYFRRRTSDEDIDRIERV